jgi:LPS sulfotransferase NodH
VQQLPRTKGGKLLRHALADLTASEHDAQRTVKADQPSQSTLPSPLSDWTARLWAEVLGVEATPLDGDFFQMGGDSMSAAMVVHRLETQFPGELFYVSSIYDAPTPTRYAAFLTLTYPELARRLQGAASGAIAPSELLDLDRLTIDDYRKFCDCVVSPLGVPSARSADGSPGLRNPRAVFLLSAPRSGSTLLRAMLAGHSQLFSPPELYLLPHWDMGQRSRWYSGGHATQKEGLLRAVMQARSCTAEAAADVVGSLETAGAPTRFVYRQLQTWIGEHLLVDKTPFNAVDPQVLGRIEKEFDQPLYIHLSRNPYGMIRSFVEARLGQLWWPRLIGPSATRRMQVCPFPARHLAELIWLRLHSNIVQTLDSIPPHRQLHLNFESLVADPTRSLDRVCRLLGVDVQPAMLTPQTAAASRMIDGIRAESRMIGDPKFFQHRGIDGAVAEQWKRAYSSDFLGSLATELSQQLGHRETPASASGRIEFEV